VPKNSFRSFFNGALGQYLPVIQYFKGNIFKKLDNWQEKLFIL
jgi:hypothetical protein